MIVCAGHVDVLSSKFPRWDTLPQHPPWYRPQGKIAVFQVTSLSTPQPKTVVVKSNSQHDLRFTSPDTNVLFGASSAVYYKTAIISARDPKGDLWLVQFSYLVVMVARQWRTALAKISSDKW